MCDGFRPWRRNWTPAARAAAAERGVQGWRVAYPERAAVRDLILPTAQQEPCDRCGSADARLFVTDYQTRAHVWRCRECAAAARAEYVAERITAEGVTRS